MMHTYFVLMNKSKKKYKILLIWYLKFIKPLALIQFLLSSQQDQRKELGVMISGTNQRKLLSEALDSKGLDWSLLPGEGAFYGPK